MGLMFHCEVLRGSTHAVSANALARVEPRGNPCLGSLSPVAGMFVHVVGSVTPNVHIGISLVSSRAASSTDFTRRCTMLSGPQQTASARAVTGVEPNNVLSLGSVAPAAGVISVGIVSSVDPTTRLGGSNEASAAGWNTLA